MKEELLSVEELKRQLYAHGLIGDMWSVDDILNSLESYCDDFIYSKDDAYEILTYVDDTADATYGINWDVISEAICYHFNSRPLNHIRNILSNCEKFGFILSSPDEQEEGIMIHLSLEHNKAELTEESFKEVVRNYIDSQNHKPFDVFEITYLDSNVVQRKTLIKHSDHTDIIKPLSTRKNEIEIDLNDKKFKKKKDKVAKHQEELLEINEKLSKFNFEYFTEKSPLYGAIECGFLYLPPAQGNEHEVVMIKVQ